MCIEKIIPNDWEKLEALYFTNHVRCYRLIVNEQTFNFIGPVGTMHQIDKKVGKNNRKCVLNVAANPRHFLDNAEKGTTIVIPYSFWTCNCETGFVRTPYSSKCPKCQCDINETSQKASYLEDISFVS